MKLSLLENGLDSLKSGYASLLEFEKLYLSSGSEYEKSVKLKNAIVLVHHGIEILMKHILFSRGEYLVFSSIDKHVKAAYVEQRQKQLSSIFQTSNIDRIHTVTYIEAVERIESVLGYEVQPQLMGKLQTLENLRNRLTHAEIYVDDFLILDLFSGLINEIDIFFYTCIGQEYRTLSGYSQLIANSKLYSEWLQKNGKELKAKFLSSFVEIVKANGISIGGNDVVRITDLNVAMKIFNELYRREFRFGTDLFNNFCSGNVSSIKRIGATNVSMFTADNNTEYIFAFRSMIIFLPRLDSDASPIFFFESEDDGSDFVDKEEVYGSDNKYIVRGIKIVSENDIVYDKGKLNKFLDAIDEGEEDIPEYHHVRRFLSKSMFCFINIQGLGYGKLSMMLRDHQSTDGQKFEMGLRAALSRDNAN